MAHVLHISPKAINGHTGYLLKQFHLIHDKKQIGVTYNVLILSDTGN